MTEEKKDIPTKVGEKTSGNEEEVKIPEKFKKMVTEIEKMSVLDLSELVKILEKKFNVSASAPMMVASAGAGISGSEEGSENKEEKSSFNIELKSVGDKKIEVIKVVRDLTGKGLKEAKDLVDSAASSSQIVSEGVKKEDAEEIKKKFEAAGAQIELK
jgi:large subunit ribosomal protein L7/L12